MLIIPAIDLKEGQCVRLKQGRMEDDTIFSSDPVAIAGRWIDAGARRLHIIDLNGAFAGQPVNAEVVRQISQTYPQIPIQVGGGIRDISTIQAYFEMGVKYVIIGTKAVTTPQFVADACRAFPGQIIVALDARDGKVATEGWSKLSHHTAIEIGRHFEQDGVTAILFTDISRDGMLQGLNVQSTVELARAVTIPIIAAGGITSLDDIRALCEVTHEGVIGAVTGRAIYQGTLDFTKAQNLADGCGHRHV
ncbi:MAG: 1-(5-phosphoribosyl)-5-[(5-phosphoribosylamino)methylideneamino]imidazole-4-carboxamide isomerase [Beggiatoa sp. IS2]|nr:MAG: 1-(5-phosphoribosyl)-5-[(5-phosphoribosylamino)methylideneamino]imidazole-4-carboxamide isomerase [Beggiatoa sp. IS2]